MINDVINDIFNDIVKDIIIVALFLVCIFLPAVESVGQPMKTSDFTLANSIHDEMDPVISPDGKLMFLTIGSHEKNIGGMRDPGDIWFSIRGEDGLWSEPIHGGSLINDRTYNAVAGFSWDGKTIYLMNHFSGDGSTAGTQGISASTNRGGGWSAPENISIPFFRNTSAKISGYINTEGTVFIYAAETYGSLGVEDIFVALKDTNDKWKEPVNLGPAINTRFQEVSPSLSADTRTLYFSSNGRGGKGSFDVFRASRLDDSWTNWSAPEELPSRINTEGRDLYYREVSIPAIGVFTSTKNSDGYGDIHLYISDNQDSITITVSPDSATNHPIINTVPERFSLISVTGKVMNALTGQSLDAQLVFTGKENAKEVLSGEGKGYLVGLAPEKYEVKIQSDGYISTLETLELSQTPGQNIEMNFNLQPVRKGATVTLKSILFAQGTVDLLPESYPELNVVVEFLKTNPKVKIELSGHTDNRGNEALNVELSKSRAEKVQDYLVSKGISRRRTTGKGYGSSKPVAGNDTEESRQLNRRVDFTIRKD